MSKIYDDDGLGFGKERTFSLLIMIWTYTKKTQENSPLFYELCIRGRKQGEREVKTKLETLFFIIKHSHIIIEK